MSINKELLERYASLKATESEIKDQIDELKGLVLKEIQDAGAEEVEVENVGKFTVVPKRTYKYPAAIVTMEEDLKKAQKDAIAKGDATYEESAYVKFNALKDNS